MRASICDLGVPAAFIIKRRVVAGGALETIAASGMIEKIVCTDSHPRARAVAHPILHVQSVAPAFVPFVTRGP